MVVNRRLVHECEHLGRLEKSDSEGKNFFIDITDYDLTPKEFMPTFDYFRTGTIGPTLYGDQFSDADLAGDKRSNLAEFFAKAFITAHKIHHAPLQSIIFNKIRALSPLDPLSILIVAERLRQIGSIDEQNEVEEDIRAWMRDQMVSFYWVIARDHTSALQGLLERDHELRMSIYEALAKYPLAGKRGLDDD